MEWKTNLKNVSILKRYGGDRGGGGLNTPTHGERHSLKSCQPELRVGLLVWS